MNTIYLDHNSTTPLDERVFLAMLPFMREYFYNPGGIHSECKRVAEAIEIARLHVVNLINANDGVVIFTATATEANGLALGSKGVDRLLVSRIEHPSVIRSVENAEIHGAEVLWLDVDEQGLIDPNDIACILSDKKPTLVSVQHANQVIHTIQPIKEIADICKSYSAIMHVDAAQTSARLPIDVFSWGIDLLTLSSHKCYGPKGAAALWASPRATDNLMPVMHGGGQEYGLRSGTLNVPAIVGFGIACQIAKERMEEDIFQQSLLGKLLWDRLWMLIPDIFLNGPMNRIPGGVHCTIKGVDTKALLGGIPEIIASTGMACSESGVDPVLSAIGRQTDSRSALRMQTGRNTTEQDIERAVILLANAVIMCRKKFQL